MTSEAEFKKVNATINQTLNNQNKVECKLPLTEEEAQNVIKIELIPFLTDVECLDGEVKYGGRGIFSVLYKSENSIKKCEVGVEFSFKFTSQNCKKGCAVIGNITAESSKIHLLNGIVSVSSIINFTCEICNNNEIEYFEKQDGMLVKNSEYSCLKQVALVNKDKKLTDEFDLQVLIGNVLSHEEKVYISEVQCGIGSVIVDGEVVICGLVNSLGGDSIPTTFKKTIPFRIDVECDEALPNYFSVVNADVKNVNLKVFVDEAKNKSAVSVDVDLNFNVMLFEDVKICPAIDVYSLNNKLKLNYKEDVFTNFLKYNCLDFKFNNKIDVNLQENSRLSGVLNVKIEKSDVELKNGNLKVEGVLCVAVLDNVENLTTTEILVPFSTEERLEADFICSKRVVLKDYDVKIDGSELYIDYLLKVCFVEGKTQNVKTISSIEVGEPIKVNDSAISVYIPSSGDTLWDVCKVLCVSEKTILDLNKELEFPLNGDERIVVYREINSDKL